MKSASKSCSFQLDNIGSLDQRLHPRKSIKRRENKIASSRAFLAAENQLLVQENQTFALKPDDAKACFSNGFTGFEGGLLAEGMGSRRFPVLFEPGPAPNPALHHAEIWLLVSPTPKGTGLMGKAGSTVGMKQQPGAKGYSACMGTHNPARDVLQGSGLEAPLAPSVSQQLEVDVPLFKALSMSATGTSVGFAILLLLSAPSWLVPMGSYPMGFISVLWNPGSGRWT